MPAARVMSSEFLLSIVIPIFNEEPGIRELVARLKSCIAQLDGRCEIVFVNDGSRDGSLKLLKQMKQENAQLSMTIVDLSRNFGHQMALTAGMDFAKGE